VAHSEHRISNTTRKDAAAADNDDEDAANRAHSGEKRRSQECAIIQRVITRIK
jgi:hypothetical protein